MQVYVKTEQKKTIKSQLIYIFSTENVFKFIPQNQSFHHLK